MTPIPPRARIAIVSFAVLAMSVATGSARAADGQLPDLVPLAPGSVRLGTADGEPYGSPPSVLRFAISVANRGAFPLDVLGVPTSVERASALQCNAFAGERACTGRREVGALVFHWNHQHWHIEAFARYELRPLLADGTPDLAADPLSVSDKVSFCLMDTARDPGTPEAPLAGTGLYATCTGFVQGISPGWMDVYTSGLFGQQLTIDGVPDGQYAIVVTANPLGLLLEADASNNVAFTAIALEDGGTTVRVL